MRANRIQIFDLRDPNQEKVSDFEVHNHYSPKRDMRGMETKCGGPRVKYGLNMFFANCSGCAGDAHDGMDG